MLLVDLHEPDNIVKLLKQSTPVTVTNLNGLHMSDFFFGNYDGKRFQFSRKQAGELVGNIDEAEDQLRDYYNQADENFQIIEGIISPVRLHGFPISDHSPASSKVSTRDLGDKLYCYQVQPSGHIERGHSFSAINISILHAWIHRLAQAGIVTYYTLNWIDTAKLLSIIYRNEQKPPEEHHTLKRIIKPRIYIKDADPFVKALLFVGSAYKLQIGETRAKALADRFVNLFDLAMSSVEEITEVEGIGKTVAKKILNALRGE